MSESNNKNLHTQTFNTMQQCNTIQVSVLSNPLKIVHSGNIT